MVMLAQDKQVDKLVLALKLFEEIINILSWVGVVCHFWATLQIRSGMESLH